MIYDDIIWFVSSSLIFFILFVVLPIWVNGNEDDSVKYN